jgi:tetratricopeptide (TPR) repeat protein
MDLRPKTKRRLLILLTAGVGFLGVAMTVVVIGLHRHELHRLAFRTTAMDAFNRGDYRTAAENFAKYLGNDQMDSQAIFDFAVARSRLPRADMSNLIDAGKLFSRYLELQPGDVEAQHQLLTIDQKLRYTAEATQLAGELLAKNPDDVQALSANLAELIRTGRYQQALPVAMRVNELSPLDVSAQQTTYELMVRLHKPPQEIIDRADRMLSAHPADPRFELLRAVAAFSTGDHDGTIKWLRTAATRPPPDADFILLLAGAFDRLGMWTDSRALLEKNATAPTASPILKANFVQRLWEIGQYDQALALLNGINPADPASDPNLIGLRDLVLYTKDPSHLPVDFKTALTALQQRQDDLFAIGWTDLLQAIASDAPATPLDTVRLLQSGVRSDSNNPDIRYYLGRQYLRLGESELALQSLRQTTQMQPEWAAPYVLIARTLMQRGQIADAADAARSAYQRDSQSPGVQITYAIVSYHQLGPAATAADIHPLLDVIQQLRRIDPSDSQLLTAEIDLLARSNQSQEAVDRSVASLATTAGALPSTLRQLAMVDRSDHLGITALLMDRLAEIQPTTPPAALDQVQADLITGNADAAKALLPAMAARPTPGWTLASLQAREAIGDSTVATAWEKFADSLPNDLDVQQAALHSPVVAANRPLMDRTIDRIKTLTGDDAIEWKLARASWQLGATENLKTAANTAAASMAEVVRIAPHYARPQIIWADALAKLGDFNGAIAHLSLAQQIEPDNADVALNLANLYLRQGQFTELSSLLSTTQTNAWLTNPERIEIARIYRQIADRTSAIKLLDENGKIHPDDPERDILLAQLHAEAGEDAAAESLYNAWLKEEHPAAVVLEAIARFQASRDSLEKARQTLAKLDDASLPKGQKDLIVGDFEAEVGDKKIAATDFQNAANAAPGDEHIWLAWAGRNLRNGDFTGAFTVAAEGLKHLPANPSLMAMSDRAQALAGLQLDSDSQGLLDVLSIDPTNEAAVATLAALSAGEATTDTTERLRSVTEKFPRFLPAANMVISRDFKAGQIDQAIDRATRLCDFLPTETAPEQLLTIIYSASGQPERALAAAQQWRNRSLDHPHPADVAIASALLALHQPEPAIQQISWVLKSPTQSKALELYARALCMTNRSDDAWHIVQPYAAESSLWRQRWLRIVADTSPDPATAAQRIHDVEPMLVASSADEQISLAQAWYSIAIRFDDADSLTKAKSIVKPIADSATPPVTALLLLGQIDQQQNDLPNAEINFTRATKIAPQEPIAKNNLAMVMLLRNEDLKTAQQLATSAIESAPANSALHSTLGEIDQQLNDPQAARTQFQFAIRLNVQNVEAMLGLATVQNQTGETNNANNTLHQAEAVMELTHPTLSPLARAALQRLRRGSGNSTTTTTATGHG